MSACGRCGKSVYAAEETKAIGKSWHTQNCFSCKECGAALDSKTLQDNGTDIFCVSCYGKLLGPKGFRGGAGAFQGEAKTDAPTHGLDDDLKLKKEARFDAKLMQDAVDFINSLVPGGADGSNGAAGFAESLSSGVTLCNLVNALKADTIKVNPAPKMAFHKQEQIGNFLSALPQFGLRASDIFVTVDLFEQKNIPLVIDTILRLKVTSGKV